MANTHLYADTAALEPFTTSDTRTFGTATRGSISVDLHTTGCPLTALAYVVQPDVENDRDGFVTVDLRSEDARVHASIYLNHDEQGIANAEALLAAVAEAVVRLKDQAKAKSLRKLDADLF